MQHSHRKYVAIEGNIGAGKSCLVDNLNLDTTKTFLKEPVDGWKDSLVAYYEDPSRNAYLFQMEILRTRTRQLLTAPSDKPIVTERSIQSGKGVFVRNAIRSGLLSPVEVASYEAWDAFVTTTLDMPPMAAIIFVNTPVDVCLARTLTRARPGEGSISMEYLTDVAVSYDEWIAEMRRDTAVPIFVLDGTKDEEEVAVEGKRIIANVFGE